MLVKLGTKIDDMSHNVTAALLFAILILVASSIGIPLQQQQKVYASSQSQTQAPVKTTPQGRVPPPSTPICNPNALTLQPGSTGAKLAELHRVLTVLGYGYLLGQGGTNGKFATSTQNAVKRIQQDNRIPVDGRVESITWGALCSIIPNSFIVQLDLLVQVHLVLVQLGKLQLC